MYLCCRKGKPHAQSSLSYLLVVYFAVLIFIYVITSIRNGYGASCFYPQQRPAYLFLACEVILTGTFEFSNREHESSCTIYPSHKVISLSQNQNRHIASRNLDQGFQLKVRVDPGKFRRTWIDQEWVNGSLEVEALRCVNMRVRIQG